ncbi:MAG TPA: RNA methyltransferase [Polyangiaceae bacterium]|nr:RNA methyltransferase [Polyangiaceae bacterium]
MTGARTGDPRCGVEQTLEQIARLQHSRRERDARGLYYAEGVRNFVSAVDHGAEIEGVVVSERLLTSGVTRQLVRKLRAGGLPTVSVSPEQFRGVCKSERASGIGAILRYPLRPLHGVQPRKGTCWVALTQVRSPGNLGSLIRTSAAVGGAGFILVGGAVDPFDPSVVRASMGSLFRQTFVRTGAPQLLHFARRHRLQLVGVSPDGDAVYDAVRYRSTPIFVLGDERRGLDPEQRRLCQQLVRIPMLPGTDSLNLAVAGSLMIYEAFRHVRARPGVHSV